MIKMQASASGGRTQCQRQLKGDFSLEKGTFAEKTNESDEFLLAVLAIRYRNPISDVSSVSKFCASREVGK